jgi:hypothetical protein
MKANNLTICVDAVCGKNCPYCVSKMTWNPTPNEVLFTRNLPKALEMARLASVSSVLITSKGEPLNSINKVQEVAKYFRTFPLEIQTNGLMSCACTVKSLYLHGFNTIAISIDKYKAIDVLADVYKEANTYGVNIRLTIVLTDMWNADPNDFFKKIKEYGIKQITFRRATIPNNIINVEGQDIATWLMNNTRSDHKKFLDYFRRDFDSKHLVRELAFGSSVYDLGGISISIIDYCIQEHNNTEDIRSLIYHQDGHMYTSWDKQGSILF